MRIPLKVALISICCLAIISVACSFPFFEKSEEEVVIPTLPPQVITALVTATPVEVTAATSTPAPTAIVVMKVDWDEQWTIWMGDSTRGYTINFLVQGEKLSGSTVLADHNSILFIGTIQEDGGTVIGKWENTNGTEGNFTIYMDASGNLFTGNMDNAKALCGTRNNSIKPSNCFK